MIIELEWSDFYKDSPDIEINDGNQQVSAGSKSNYYVKLCLFKGFTDSSISFTSSSENTKILTEDTSFSRCSSSTYGGSIYFKDKGQFSQNRVCSYRSKTSQDGVFCHITVSNLYKNNLFDSSISFSGDDTNTGNCNIYMRGSCNISNINASRAKLYCRCLFNIGNINNESTIIQSTFANNSQTSTDSYYYSSYIGGTSSSIGFKILQCNFLNNIGSVNSYSALICSVNLNTLISNSSFIGNTKNTYRFFKGSGSMKIEHCCIKDTQPDGGSPNIVNTINEKSTAILSHFSTFECYAEFPLSYTIKPKNSIRIYINPILSIISKLSSSLLPFVNITEL